MTQRFLNEEEAKAEFAKMSDFDARFYMLESALMHLMALKAGAEGVTWVRNFCASVHFGSRPSVKDLMEMGGMAAEAEEKALKPKPGHGNGAWMGGHWVTLAPALPPTESRGRGPGDK